jgi:putative acetyltransferase
MTGPIRSAARRDRPAILTLVEAAFSNADRDASEEVAIVMATWARGAGIDSLELVAVDAGEIVGHALGASGDLEGRPVVAVAPVCVAPSCQAQGIGSALMAELLRRAEHQKWPLVLLLGDPEYYQRFGFEPAGPLGIYYRPAGKDNPHFQVRRLAGFDPSLRGDFTYCWESGSE